MKKILFLLCLLVISAQATAIKWNSAASTSFKTAANWLGGTGPGVNDTALFDGTSIVNCTVDTNYKIK